MVAVLSSNPTGGNFFYFLKPLVSFLYRNVRFVLKTKNPSVTSLWLSLTPMVPSLKFQEAHNPCIQTSIVWPCDTYLSYKRCFQLETNCFVCQENKNHLGVQGNKDQNMSGGLFYLRENVLLVADEENQSIQLLNPENGYVIRSVSMPQLGEIQSLGMCNDQIIMVHLLNRRWKVSYAHLLNIICPSFSPPSSNKIRNVLLFTEETST